MFNHSHIYKSICLFIHSLSNLFTFLRLFAKVMLYLLIY